jgi:C-terminal processing protease CtpA/Prc
VNPAEAHAPRDHRRAPEDAAEPAAIAVLSGSRPRYDSYSTFMSSDQPPSGPPNLAGLIKIGDFFQIAKIYGGLAYLGSMPGSPAERARLQRGDVVVSVNGIPTPDIVAFIHARSQRDGGATVRYIRGGVENEVELVWPLRPSPAPSNLQ